MCVYARVFTYSWLERRAAKSNQKLHNVLLEQLFSDLAEYVSNPHHRPIVSSVAPLL